MVENRTAFFLAPGAVCRYFVARLAYFFDGISQRVCGEPSAINGVRKNKAQNGKGVVGEPSTAQLIDFGAKIECERPVDFREWHGIERLENRERVIVAGPGRHLQARPFRCGA